MVLSLASRAWQWLLNRVWYVHPAQVMLVRASPAACAQVLAKAAKPSTERLHLRNLFAEGRRYYLRPAEAGFRMHSTQRSPWRRGRRDRVASVLTGRYSEIDAETTRIDLRARIALPFFLDVFLLPGWMSLLLLFGPLPVAVGLGASLFLLLLSWVWHWYSAALQATEMIYFVQVALDDLPAATLPALETGGDPVIYADFAQQWQKFYEEHRGEEEV